MAAVRKIGGLTGGKKEKKKGVSSLHAPGRGGRKKVLYANFYSAKIREGGSTPKREKRGAGSAVLRAGRAAWFGPGQSV